MVELGDCLVPGVLGHVARIGHGTNVARHLVPTQLNGWRLPDASYPERVGTSSRISPGRFRRLREELDEELPGILAETPDVSGTLDELSYALWPPVHEGRVTTYGAIVAPTSDPETWTGLTGLTVHHRMARGLSNDATRRFADGMTSWVLRRPDATTELVVFDRLASSERDLVVLAESSGGVLVQRHPNGIVRMVGPFGVARFTGGAWHHQPPVDHWLDAVRACQSTEQQQVLKRLLRFAVHDLGSRRIGSLLVYRAAEGNGTIESPYPTPPPLNVKTPASLAPLQHVLSQLDGAAVFDEHGSLVGLGVRLVPSRAAEDTVAPIGGTRHTNARLFSVDEPDSVIIAISEDGPVTVFRRGEVLGRSGTIDSVLHAVDALPDPVSETLAGD